MKDIKGYEGLYAVTEDGQVWSYRSKKFLKPTKDKDGYLRVCLYKDGEKKKHYIHRLTATAYIPNPDNKPTVDHIVPVSKGGTNEISNLRWATYSEQEANKDQSCKKRSRKARKNYCVELNKVFDSCIAAAREIGCNEKTIRRVLNGELKTAKGYHFISYDDYLDMLVAELLEAVFLENENESETDGLELISICGVPLNEYLQTKNN